MTQVANHFETSQFSLEQVEVLRETPDETLRRLADTAFIASMKTLADEDNPSIIRGFGD